MTGRTRKRHNESAVAKADSSSVIREVDDAKDDETKAKFLKRVAKEDKANKEIYKKESHYIEVVGKKVLLRYKNKLGSMYTRYWFNAKRNAKALDLIKSKGGDDIEENGKKEFYPLLYIDGRPFKKKD